MWVTIIGVNIRILKLLVAFSISAMNSALTIATFLPNWFLISPILMASGACSLMTEASSARMNHMVR